MKLLVLTPFVPYPINSGGNYGVYALIDRLRKHADITMILMTTSSTENEAETLKEIWADVVIHTYRRNSEDTETGIIQSWLNKIHQSTKRKLVRSKLNNHWRKNDLVWNRSTTNYDNFDFYHYIDEGYIELVHQVIMDNVFDIIQVDFFEALPIINILPHDVKKVFIHHELRYVKNNCEIELFQTIEPTDIYTSNLSYNIEIQHLKAFDGVVAMTEIDKQKLVDEGLLANNVYVSPAIMDIPNTELNDEYQFNNKLIYLGGSDHFPNHDAVNYFLGNCWENIYQKNTNLEFHIIGNWNRKIVQGFDGKFKNVFFRGFVDNLEYELSNSILVVPLRIGSGVRMKILEAISFGCPVITTSIGAEGIDLVDGVDAIYADNSETFISEAIELASDNNLCKFLRRNAVAKLHNRLSPDDLMKIRLNAYKSIINK